MAGSRKQRKKKDRKRGGIPDPTAEAPGRIRPEDPSKLDEIVFSFKYLRDDPPVSQSFPDGYLAELLGCFRAFSERQRNEIVGNRNPSMRAHGIDWAKSNVPDGFAHLPPHLRTVAGFQLTIRKDTFGRVVGFLSGVVFYVCWLDPNHETTGR